MSRFQNKNNIWDPGDRSVLVVIGVKTCLGYRPVTQNKDEPARFFKCKLTAVGSLFPSSVLIRGIQFQPTVHLILTFHQGDELQKGASRKWSPHTFTI